MADSIVVPNEPTAGTEVEPATDLSGVRRVIQQKVLNQIPMSDDVFGGPQIVAEEPGIIDAAVSGFTSIGIVTGFGEHLSEITSDEYSMVTNELDETFDVSDYAKSDPVIKQTLTEALKMEHTDPGFKTLIEQYENSRNSSQARYAVQQMIDYKENKRIAEEAGLVPWFVGAAGSVALDVLASMAVTGGTSLPAILTETTLAARLAAGGRLAVLGAAEGGLEMFAQDIEDPSVTLEDYAIATGAGALLTGLLGAAFPGFFGGYVSKQTLVRNEIEAAQSTKEMIDQVEGRLESMGAARVNEGEFDSKVPEATLDAPTATRGTGSLIADKVLVGPLRGLRSPKRRLADAIKQATKERARGLQGNDRLTAVLSRMYKVSTLTAEDLEGVGRQETMQEALELLQTRLTVHEFSIRNTYESFMTETMGRSTFKTRVLNDEIGGRLARAAGDDMPSQAEMRRVADQYAQARGEGDLDSLETILGKLEDRIPAEHIEKYRAAIAEMADKDDDWFFKMGQAEVDLGFIKGPVTPGYRPQNWNFEAVQAHSIEFADQIEELLSRDVDIEWAHDAMESLGKRAVDEEGNVANYLVRREESWDELAERLQKEDPELLSDLMNDWDALNRERVADKLLEAQGDLEQELAKFLDKTVDEVLAKAGVARRRAQTRLAKMNEELMELKRSMASAPKDISGKLRLNPQQYQTAFDIDALNTKIAKLEYRIEADAGRVQALQSLKARIDNLESSLDGNPQSRMLLRTQIEDAQNVAREIAGATRKGAKGAKPIKAKLSKLERAANRAAGRLLLRDAANEITEAISRRRSPGGFHVDDALQNSRFFKRRALNLKGVRHEERWQRFLNSDGQLNMEIYVQSVGRQLEMRRKYAPFLTAKGYLKEGDDDVFEALQKYITDGFEEDRRVLRQMNRDGKLSDDKLKEELARIEADLKDAKDFNSKAFGEFTRSDYLKHANESWDRVISIAQSATAAMALGKVALTMIADMAMVAFGGTRFGTGVFDFFRQVRNKGILEDIEKDDVVLAMALRGERVMANGVGVSRFDLDAPSLEVPGGKLASVQRITHSIAQKEMWFNLMHVWNRMVRSSFGIGFMRQITKDLDNYSSMPADLKGFYAKHGIGADEAQRMKKMYTLHSRDVNGIRIPDLEAWAKAGESDLVDRFYRAVNGAGNEALLDPGLGDRPFFRSSPLGRLVMQFQSFTYAAGERWFSPMVQQGLIRPTDVRFLMSGLFALTLAGLGNAARESLRGEEPKLFKALEGDGQAFWEVMKESWIKSPLAIGLMGTATDVMGTQLANPVNSAFQALTGSDAELLNSEYLRFKQQQGIFGAAGPTLGMVNTWVQIGRTAAEGDVERALGMTAVRTPIVNALPWLVLYKIGQKMNGD